jgi:hypothetical protein
MFFSGKALGLGSGWKVVKGETDVRSQAASHNRPNFRYETLDQLS